MKKNITALFLCSMLMLSIYTCAKNTSKTQVDTQLTTQIIHLPAIPKEIKHNGLIYKVLPDDDVDKYIGKEIEKGFNKETHFRIFSLKNNDEKDAIAILVRENPRIYYRAIRK